MSKKLNIARFSKIRGSINSKRGYIEKKVLIKEENTAPVLRTSTPNF